MGFLHKLWDETLAGPTPETGLAKLRKYNSFSAAAARSAAAAAESLPPPPPPEDNQVRVSRSITILRNNQNPAVRNFSADVPDSGPDSPSSSCPTPRTPLTPGTPSANFRRWRSMKLPGTADALEGAEQRR